MKSRTIALAAAGGVAAGLASLAAWPRGEPRTTPQEPGGAALDAAFAAASTAAKAGSATVVVYDDGLPVPDCWVVFHDDTGAVTSAMKTGNDGKASAPMGPHGMITVAYGTSVKHLVTITGVEPEDHLVVGEEEDEGAPEEAVCQARITLPAAPSSGARHVVTLGVGTTEVPDSRAPFTASVLERFIVKGKFPVLAEALGKGGEPVAFAHAWGEGCRADAGAVDVPLRAWSTDYRTFPVQVSGRAEEGATLAGEFFILGQETDRLRRGRHQEPIGDHTVFRFTAPRPVGTHAAYELVATRAGSEARSVILERRLAMPEHVNVDLQERLLPRVEGVRVEAPDSARPSVRWDLSAPAPSADGVVVRLSWPETSEHVWRLVAHPDRPSRMVIPALPDALAAWRPDARKLTAAVAIVDASFVDGFADLKKRGLVALEDPPKKAETTVLRYSATGDLRF